MVKCDYRTSSSVLVSKTAHCKLLVGYKWRRTMLFAAKCVQFKIIKNKSHLSWPSIQAALSSKLLYVYSVFRGSQIQLHIRQRMSDAIRK